MKTINNIEYKTIKPTAILSDFVESFWMLDNQSGSDQKIVVLPDGSIDLILSQGPTESFQIAFMGIGTYADQVQLPAKARVFGISFKLLAAECVFKKSVSHLLNNAESLPADFWDFNFTDLNDFDLFHKKASQKIQSLLPLEIDNRKQKIFDLIYSSNGALTVQNISEQVFWSSRQINRYFNQQYGLSLKAYCSILRFRASFGHIKEGKLFPQQNFTDQSHFIKEIKKLSGVLPKELRHNKNDRFLQFSMLNRE